MAFAGQHARGRIQPDPACSGDIHLGPGVQIGKVDFRATRSIKRGLIGTPQAIDLNLISAPPDKPGVPPYRPALRDDLPAGARALEKITIE